MLYRGLRDRLFGVEGEWTLRRCANERCGLLWLDPVPVESDIDKLYENYGFHQDTEVSNEGLRPRTLDRIRNAYCSSRYGYPGEQGWSGALRHVAFLLPGYRAQWDFGVFYLPAQPRGRLLDVGCGTGRMMQRMADLGWEVRGIDFAPKAVEVARGHGLDVRLGSLDEQDFADDFFDAVVMSHVIEHVVDPRALLESCKRVLKPGGRLVAITPNASAWGHQLYERDWYNLDPPRHLHVFTPEAMRRLAQEVAFHTVHVSTVIANAHGVLWSSKRLKDQLEVNQGAYSRPQRAGSRTMQFAEWMRLRIDRDSGEDILLYAMK